MPKGKNLSPSEAGRIRQLLADTDVSMTLIAKRMNCSKSTVVHFNERERVREYGGHRTEWTTESGPMDDQLTPKHYKLLRNLTSS